LAFVEVTFTRWTDWQDPLCVSRGINCSPNALTHLGTAFSPPWVSPAFPAFPPHSRTLATQVMSARACGLERAPIGSTIAPPPCVSAHLQTGLACQSWPGCPSDRLLPSDL